MTSGLGKEELTDMFRLLIIATATFLIVLTSCKSKVKIKPDPYTGPVIEAYHIETKYSDSARLKINVKAPKELEYENGDRHFPDGINMDFYDIKTGKQTSYLKGNSARYNKEKNQYVVTGDVIVQSLEEKEKLNTEELVWHPADKKITSDKFVRIETPDEIVTGTGLVSNEDFSNYRILNIKATIFRDEEE
jgi:LPS export ABC transporter protein LptC